MCGIAGIFGWNNQQKAEDQLRTMCTSLAHRGPDAQGLWSSKGVSLGHRRLSIIDTTPAGNQPFFSADRNIIVVFNGEIYNYLELRKELKSGYEFQTASDTEVIIAAYYKWGIACVERFIGMFGFALWDATSEKLFVVRDRLGIKPVYYSQVAGQTIFASEIRALLDSGLVSRKIDRNSLRDYLQYQTVHAPATILEGVHMLMPGTIMVLQGGDTQWISYWQPEKNLSGAAAGHDAQEARRNVRDLLTSAIELRMRADVPFGAFLSGGIDSSAVVGLMSSISSHPVQTFAITFHEKEYDESAYSSLIAKRFNTQHTEIRLHANDFLKLVPAALAAMDHPSGDGPNTYVVSKATREQGIKMALSGLGGDELFGGYDVFRRMHRLQQIAWINSIPRGLRTLAGQLLQSLKPGIASEKINMALGAEYLDFTHLYPLTRRLFSDASLHSLMRPEMSTPDAVRQLAHSLGSVESLMSRVSIAEIRSYMQNILLRDTDQMSMAHALEIRVPFLDHRLVEYVLGLRDEIKYPHTPKQLLTDALQDLLPGEIITRPKMGFTFPWALWMRNELKSLCEENIQALNRIDELNFQVVQDLWQKFLIGDPRTTWSRIWPLVTLGHWIKTHDVH